MVCRPILRPAKEPPLPQIQHPAGHPPLVFECANEGPPIAEDIAAHLFDPYFVSGEDGTGLGLALVEQRVRELGGRIDLVNEPDNIIFRVLI